MSSAIVCQLCQKPIQLENARVNELGKPVHQECYVLAIKQSKVEPAKADPGAAKSS